MQTLGVFCHKKGMIISNGVFQSPRCRVFNLVREMNAVTAFSGRVAGTCHLPCLAGHFWAPHLRSYVSERFEVLRQGKKFSFTSKMLGDTGIRGFLVCSQAFWPRKSNRCHSLFGLGFLVLLKTMLIFPSCSGRCLIQDLIQTFAQEV